MAKKIFLLGLILLSVANVKAQTRTQTDSLTMETMLHNLPEVMVKGSRPIVKAERGMLSYNMPLLLKQLPADNAYEALTRIPGVSDATGSISFSGNEVNVDYQRTSHHIDTGTADRASEGNASRTVVKSRGDAVCPSSLSCAWHGYQHRHERLRRYQSAFGTNHWWHAAKQIRQ